MTVICRLPLIVVSKPLPAAHDESFGAPVRQTPLNSTNFPVIRPAVEVRATRTRFGTPLLADPVTREPFRIVIRPPDMVHVLLTPAPGLEVPPSVLAETMPREPIEQPVQL